MPALQDQTVESAMVDLIEEAQKQDCTAVIEIEGAAKYLRKTAVRHKCFLTYNLHNRKTIKALWSLRMC